MRVQTFSQWCRRGAGVVDAGVSSLGNLAVSVVASQHLPLAQFGELTIGMLVGLILVGVSRALLGDALTITYSGRTLNVHAAAAKRATEVGVTAALLAAPVAGAILGGVSLIAGAQPRTAAGLAAALTVVGPLLVIQELMRAVAYSGGHPLRALPNTVAWTLTLIGALVALPFLPVERSPAVYLTVWGASTAPGAIIGLKLNAVTPRVGRIGPWLHDHWVLIRRLFLDYSLTQVTAEASIVVISAIAGASETGLLRKAQIPLAPIVILTTGVMLVAQPALLRMVAAGAQVPDIRRVAYRIGAATASVAALSGLILLTLPVNLMDQVLGGDWGRARELVPIYACYLGLGAVAGCQGVALRSLDRLGQQVRLRIFLTPAILAIVGLSALGGAGGAVIGLTLGVGVVVFGWAWLLRAE